MTTKINSFKKTHSINSWLNLIFSIFIVAGVFVGVVINLLAMPTELVKEVGIKTFRMFTVLSNMLVAFSVAMTIPFTVDGIRQKNYHLPRWIVNLTFISVTCVSLTFIISLTLLSAYAGFVRMMASGSNLFLHTLVPIASIISFLFINTSHNVKFKTSFYALIPIFVYAIVYLISAIFIGEGNGGWRDHYRFNAVIPWYFIFIIIFALAFGVANLLRAVHNHMHRRDKSDTEEFYINSNEYDLPSIEEAIVKIARENKQMDKGGEIVVPRRIIIFLEKKYQSKKPLSELCQIYINEYLN